MQLDFLSYESKKFGMRFAILSNMLLALIMVGYPLSASISQLLEMETSTINISYRLFVIVLSFIVASWSLVKGVFRTDPLILLFLSLYTIRMFWDFSYSNFPDVTEDFQFYLATVLVPSLAVGAGRLWYDEKLCLQFILGIGGLSGLFIAYLLNYSANTAALAQLGGRATLDFLNPISIGYQGLYIGAAALMLIVRSGGMSRRLILYFLVIVLGGYLLIVSGSRGPIVALLFGVGLTALANSRAASTYIPVSIVLIVLLAVVGAPELVAERFMSAGEDTSSLERFYTIELSIAAALSQPILGFGYIEPFTNSYPHNLLVEAALALGIGGAVLMAWLQCSLVYNSWRLARMGEWLLPFLAATVFANAWISSSIWSAAPLFVLAWIIRGRTTAASQVAGNLSGRNY